MQTTSAKLTTSQAISATNVGSLLTKDERSTIEHIYCMAQPRRMPPTQKRNLPHQSFLVFEHPNELVHLNVGIMCQTITFITRTGEGLYKNFSVREEQGEHAAEGDRRITLGKHCDVM